MSKAIRDKAKELLGYGLSKQVVFDTIVIEHPEAKPKTIAGMLRYMPTQWAKKRHGGAHRAMLGLIALAALLRVAGHIWQHDIRWDMPTAYLTLVPIASLLVGWSMYRWSGQVFEWVGWGNAIGAWGLVEELRDLAEGRGDAGSILYSAMSAGIGALALYLAHKVFAKPRVVKDPLGGPDRFVFPAEEGL